MQATHTDAREAARAQAADRRAGTYLTFKLGSEVYGLPILRVQEIIGRVAETAVPQAPPFVRGVINLRGRVLAVVDLRRKLGMQPREDTDKTCIIVVQVGESVGGSTLGVLVDEVHEVLGIASRQIQDPPSFGARVRGAFILGMGKVDRKVVILLDLDRALGTDGLRDLVPGV